MLSATDIKRNEDRLISLGWAYYSPVDQWRYTVGGATDKLDGTFVRGDYVDPLPQALFDLLLRKRKISQPDGRIFEIGTFDS